MSNSTTLLKGKKVLVIGGSSGKSDIYIACIGRSIATASLSNGASVVIASSSQAKVDKAIELLKKNIMGNADVTVTGEAFDMNDFAALRSFLTKKALLDYFVTTTGGPPRGLGSPPSADVDLREHMKDSMEYLAILSDFECWKNLIRPGGSITITTGSLQKRPILGAGFGLGPAGAIETATRSLAVDLKPLRINSIAPGLADIEMVQAFSDELRKPMLETFSQTSLVGHVGTPDEVAEAYYVNITGQVIIVDGGGGVLV
ncbi:Enoyl-(Acyl carrier protein) reductase [Ceratobasidium sp. AG-Ba]|nr:Enoyl-(Acyl carrier protein) reductase [Ceratobasidium sp. AG-Ba]